MEVVEESYIKQQFWETNNKWLQDFVTTYDTKMKVIMKSRGYTYVHSKERTVVFSFGEFTLRRRRWKKGKKWVVPVDDLFGLEKNVRFSLEFLYQLAHLATYMSYDKVVATIDLVYGIRITKPTVVKAVKRGKKLLEEKKRYRFYRDQGEPKPVDLLYIEGDGVWVKARDDDEENKNYDLAHFAVHTGSRKVGGKRYALENKKEFIGIKYSEAKEQLLDYIYNNYKIHSGTILITNGDGGHGYTPYMFKELASSLGVTRHEHFWDAYHVKKFVKDFHQAYPEELLERTFQAIKKHSKEELRMVLDTIESLVQTEEEMELFLKYRKKMLVHFQYTKPARLRGFEKAVVGIIESQQRKISYRMKKRGAYWTKWGADTMSQLILLVYDGTLRDLFFGSWRKKYQEYESLDKQSASKVRAGLSKVKEYGLSKLALTPSYKFDH